MQSLSMSMPTRYPKPVSKNKRQVRDLLDKGLIRESSSPWGFPVLFVKKAEGTWRMCIDYRAFNAVAVKNGYPLLRIQDCLDRIGRCRFISKIDLTSGHYQVRVSHRDIPKTAFNTRHGKYEFVAMPFGLTNAPATFQTMDNNILRPFLDKFAIVHLDDIMVFSDTLQEHVKHFLSPTMGGSYRPQSSTIQFMRRSC